MLVYYVLGMSRIDSHAINLCSLFVGGDEWRNVEKRFEVRMSEEDELTEHQMRSLLT